MKTVTTLPQTVQAAQLQPIPTRAIEMLRELLELELLEWIENHTPAEIQDAVTALSRAEYLQRIQNQQPLPLPLAADGQKILISLAESLEQVEKLNRDTAF